MNDRLIDDPTSAFSALRRFAQPGGAEERCDFCSAELNPGHRHLIEVANRKIICACDSCALRFENVIGGRFKLIPRDVQSLPDFQMDDAQWDDLALPINLAFFFYNSATSTIVAIYPSPGGPVESFLTRENWKAMIGKNPALQEMKPDVEALLINRVGESRRYLVVPIDVCYELIGLIRKNWRGFSGGEAVWMEINRLFERLTGSATPMNPPPQEFSYA